MAKQGLTAAVFAATLVALVQQPAGLLALARAGTTQKPQPKAKAPAQSPTEGRIKQAAEAKPPSSEESRWYSITEVRLKPDMVADWEALHRSVVMPALKKAGVGEVDVWETAVFGEAFQYTIITAIKNLAQYDDPAPLRKALGEEGWKDYLARRARCLVSSHTTAVLARPDLSYEGKMSGPPNLAVISIIDIAPGRGADFENYVRSDVLPVMRKAGVAGYYIDQTMFGGNTNEYVSVTLAEGFADVAKGSPFLRVLGAEGVAKLASRYAGLIVHQERFISRYVPELSFYTEPGDTQKK